jgi:hypothetical protein
MISSSDTETSDEIIDDGPDQSLSLESGGESTIEADKRSTYQQSEVNPIDFLMPILSGDLVVEHRRQFAFGERWSWRFTLGVNSSSSRG